MVEEYDKLVRDDVPAVVRENGETPTTHAATGAEYSRRLHDKLDEEVEEFHEDPSVGELADVLEVLDALADHHGLSAADVAEARAEKAAERGRFAEGVVLESVER